MRIKCAYCNKEYEKPEKRVRFNASRGIKNYCSLSCQNDAKRTGESVSCAWCGKEFYASKGRIEGSESGKLFCTRSCHTSDANKHVRTGKGNPNYKDGFSSYRRKGIAIHGSMCAVCGYDRVVQVHHIDGNRSNSDPSNLIVLCPNHHAEIHYCGERLEDLLSP